MQYVMLGASKAKCPYCGSSRIVADMRTASLVCTSCGTVIEESLPVQGSHTNEELEAVRRSRAPRRKRVATENEGKAMAFFKLSKLLNIDNARGEALKAFSSLLNNNYRDIVRELAGNPCIRNIMRKLEGNAAAAAIDVLINMASGIYPLPSTLSSTYGINKSTAKRIIVRVSKCL
jgi:ribosomal protein S27AE